jgi:CxxC motif-containing protein (DUF1111 family)
MRWTHLCWLLPSLSLSSAESPETMSGGATTVFDTGRNAYSHPLANLQTVTRRQHATGNSFFNENWVAAPASTTSRDGLGPLFNARSCSACHHLDGRGRTPEPGMESVALLIRLSIMVDSQAVPHPVYGDQIQPLSLPGAKGEARVEIEWQERSLNYADGVTKSLRFPVLKLHDWAYGVPEEKLLLSPRIANAVHGLGLLEAVPEETIRKLADPEDADGDGISGRVNEVWDKTDGRLRLGRFGWKANQPSLRQQTAEAFLGDIGITSPLLPEQNHSSAQKETFSIYPTGGDPELPENLLQRVTTYLRTLAPPARRDVSDPEVKRGAELFATLRCVACHVPELRTAETSDLVELQGHTIRPFTDLLLHDMGEGLADGRPDHLASGTEWRTPPLWGLGLQKTVNGHTQLLHDGRARDPEEAILWHGGEAEKSREDFRRLKQDDRKAVLRFLESL